MADEDTDTEEIEEIKKGPSKVLLIVIGANLVVVLGVVAFFLFGSGDEEETGDEIVPAEELMASHETMGPIFELGPIIVNLSDKGGGRYLKVYLKLECMNEKSAPIVEGKLIPLRDLVLVHFTGVTASELLGSDVKSQIRKDLINMSNKELGGTHIQNIYFSEFVIQ